MKSIVEIAKRIEYDTDLKSNLDMLITYSLSNKTLIFNQDIEGVDLYKLSECQIIKHQTEKYHLSDFETFGYCLYSLYKNENKIQLTNDFKSFVSLIESIYTDYKSDKFIQNISNLENALWAIAIIDSNQNFDIDFSDYIKSLDLEKNRSDVFSFNEAYSRSLHLLNIEVPVFFQISTQLIQWTQSDVEYNMPLGRLIRGIRNKIKENENWGFQCFEYSINQASLEIDFLIPLITGLYENLGAKFYRKNLEDKIGTEIYAVSTICGLSNVETIREEECKLFLEIYNQVDKNITQILLNSPKLLFAILKSEDKSIGNKYIEESFVLLSELIEIDNENLIYLILNRIEFRDDYIDLSKELIINLIGKPHFKFEYLSSINHLLWRLKDVSFFEIVLYSVSNILPFKSVYKSLSSSINELRSINKKEFDKVIVTLLIHDEANCRFLATEIFSDFSFEDYEFSFDILELTPLNQYKLWVSIFQNYREPKYILPCLLPLLKSASSFIKETFISKLEEYTESYGCLVTDILKQKLDFKDSELKATYKRIENYKVEFYRKNVSIKDGIKELNPMFSQNKLFVDYNIIHNRRFIRQMQKSSEENSFLTHLCSKVTLLKGGGWKMDGRDEISQLGEISTSFSLPRIYFTRPENFDFESSINMNTNWDENRFAQIKWYLENE